MKKNKLFLLLIIPIIMLSLFACSSDKHDDITGNIEIKVIPRNGVVTFFISSDKITTINWGDGKESIAQPATHLTISHRYEDSQQKTIYLSSTGLTEFSFTVNGQFKDGSFTSLKFHDCMKLQEVNCWNTTLHTLEFTKCDNLEVLECSNNQLTNLNIGSLKRLKKLSCGQNKISSLDASNCKKLTEIVCPFNGMKNLNLEGLSELEMLFCDNNDIEKLSVKGDKNLWYIEAYSNNLSSESINALFESLPSIKPTEDRKSGIIKLNLKGNGINTKIAEDKNWTVDDFALTRLFY